MYPCVLDLWPINGATSRYVLRCWNNIQPQFDQDAQQTAHFVLQF